MDMLSRPELTGDPYDEENEARLKEKLLKLPGNSILTEDDLMPILRFFRGCWYRVS